MKPFTKSTILTYAALFVSLNIFAGEPVTNEEMYIDDIPFNTELIAANALHEQAMKQQFQLAEEAYIDDIPFDTESVVKIGLSNWAMSQKFVMETEDYIEDIPFDTAKSATDFSFRMMDEKSERSK